MTKPLPTSAPRALPAGAQKNACAPDAALDPRPVAGTVADAQTPEFAPGDVIAGRHRVQYFMADSPLASHYAAQHISVSSLTYVLKVLKSDLMEYPELSDQFRLEAHSVARLRDPHSVRITDMGTLPDGRPFHCREFVRGVTLSDYLERMGPLSGALTYRAALGVLSALVEAHSLGIINRDIRPVGLILCEDKTSDEIMCRVLDFSSAYVGHGSAPAGNIPTTNPSLLMCSPQYAAPDLLQGNITPSVDTYALGLTLAELLEGEALGPAGSFFKIAQQQLSSEEWELGPRAAASPLAPIIRRAIRKKRSERYEDASEMLDDLMRNAAIFAPPGELAWANIEALFPAVASNRTYAGIARTAALETPIGSVKAVETRASTADQPPRRRAQRTLGPLSKETDDFDDVFDVIDRMQSGNFPTALDDDDESLTTGEFTTLPRALPRIYISPDEQGTAVLR